MRILFDNGTPRGLSRFLTSHTVEEARDHDWEELANGQLIEAAEQAGFDLMVTTDKNIRYQQNLGGRKLALVVLQHSQWPMVKLVPSHSTSVYPHPIPRKPTTPMPTNDPFHLQRFLDAQATTYTQARTELAAGQKRSHWMWFIFPQIQGLGSSSMAQRYAIGDLQEARAYLAHPTLGPRLHECTALVNAVQNRTLDDILGYPDNLKFHSSITLFARASEPATSADSVFHAALARWFDEKPDNATLKLLERRTIPRRETIACSLEYDGVEGN